MTKTFNIIAACVIVILAIGLYKSKSEADRMRAEVSKLEAQVAKARAEVKTMAAEAAYLENPKRVEALARQELNLAPARPDQVHPITDMDKLLPPAKKPAAGQAQP